MAAIAYAQYRNSYGCCYVTTGCGGTNAITGVLHAWQDHIPVIYISGQCNRDEMMVVAKSPVRQIGMQEANVVPIVKTITKYAVTVMDPEQIGYHLEKAIHIANTGSPGPVWLDIPLDVQEALVDTENLVHFKPDTNMKKSCTPEEIRYAVSALEEAERPILMLGHGVRIAEAINEFASFVGKYNIPFVSTRLGWDAIPRTMPLHIGLADIRGNRAANFALSNADMILVLGSRLSMFTTGINYELFGRCANKIIVVDIDEDEHRKGTVRIDKVINADVKEFLKSLPKLHLREHSDWVLKCKHWKTRWPNIPSEFLDDKNGISKHAFIGVLNRYLKPDSVVVTDAGATTEIPMQALEFQGNQRYLGSASQNEMGYALPASIGASVARQKDEVFCIVGDGSLQMNIQELQTMVTQRLPIRIFVWNNGGYATIKSHQKTIFKGRFLGVDPESGTVFPELEKIASAYNISYFKAGKLAELEACINADDFNKCDGPVIIEIITWKEEVNAMVKAQMRMEDGSRIALPIEDMFPVIPREDFLSEMLVEPIRWWKD
jgi:acetolactate synthase-1/2/3 large subunit